jgi:hypothetical protein
VRRNKVVSTLIPKSVENTRKLGEGTHTFDWNILLSGG